MKQVATVFILLSLCWLTAKGEAVVSHVSYFDEEDGLPHGHVTQMLQDNLGFVWLATWNGLCRFDGYEFHTFKPQAGDGCRMATDRFRDISLRPDGKIICRVDEGYFLFDTRDCRFTDVDEAHTQQIADEMAQYRQCTATKTADGVSFSFTDRQGSLWYTGKSGVYKRSDGEEHTRRLDIEPKAQVKSLFADSRGRYWVATKEDAALRVYSAADDRLIGYLGPGGRQPMPSGPSALPVRLLPGYTSFGVPVYSMYESADGTLWLCSKPGGLLRLRETTPGVFLADRIGGLPTDNVYNVVEDRYGRLWVATMDGGLCFTDDPSSTTPHIKTPKGYLDDVGQRVRYLHITRDGNTLLAAATDGLVVARLENDADAMQFHLHQREAGRATSLSSSATMDVVEDGRGRVFVSTESGGVNLIINGLGSADDPAHIGVALPDTLSFRHFTSRNRLLPSDVVMSLTPLGGDSLMVVGSHLVTIMDSTGQCRVLDARYFNGDYRFSDAHPLKLEDGRWLFGLTDGAFTTTTSQMYRRAYAPNVVLTAISVQGGDENWAVAYADTLVLSPRERSITVHFAALDLNAPECISYAFSLQHTSAEDGMQWNDIGHNRSATLLDLEPATYRLYIRSTDADGRWLDNMRCLTIIVTPTFFESAWGRLLIVLLVAAIVAVIAYTLLYIRRIKRKQHEILEAYLGLIEAKTDSPVAAVGAGTVAARESSTPARIVGADPAPARQGESPVPARLSVQDQAFMNRVVNYVEEHIADADANTDGMADAAAASRSVLFRKMKSIVGLTPADFLREARIKRACQLLATTQNAVADVAYSCGFSDPKYFSRCFRASTGCSPTEYRSAKEG